MNDENNDMNLLVFNECYSWLYVRLLKSINSKQ